MNQETLPQPMNANAARAEFLQGRIDTLGEDIRNRIIDMKPLANVILDLGTKIANLGSTISDLEKEIRALQDNNKEEDRARVKTLESQKAGLEADRAVLENQLAKLEAQQAKAEALLADLKAQQAIVMAELAELKVADTSQRRTNGFSKEQAAQLEGSLYGVLDENRRPCGVAFFIKPNRALTTRHNIPNCHVGSPVQLQREGLTLKVHVVSCDEDYDYAVLGPDDSKFISRHLTIGKVPPLYENAKCTLLTWFVAMANELDDEDFKPSFTMHHEVRLIKASQHRVAFNAPTFDGDSGGALILTETCEVIGMHAETVNRARELKRHKEAEDRLATTADSVESLIRGLNSGALGIRLDKFNFL